MSQALGRRHGVCRVSDLVFAFSDQCTSDVNSKPRADFILKSQYPRAYFELIKPVSER